MAGDGEGFAGSRQRGDRVVDRSVAEQGAVSVRIEAGASADALLDQPVEVDARDAQPADRIAGLEAAAVAHGQATHELLVGDAVRCACRRWR